MNNKIVTIAAGIVFFDDENGLRRCLTSIQTCVDHIIAIDGKFKYFDDDHDLSIDNSRKVVESFPNATYYCYPNLKEKGINPFIAIWLTLMIHLEILQQENILLKSITDRF